MSSSRETRWKERAPIEGLSEALTVLSGEQASTAELARLQHALAAQLDKPTRSAAAGGAASWLSLSRSWPWLSAVLLGLALSWQLMPRAEVPEPRVAAPAPLVAPLPAPPEALPLTEPASAPRPELPATKAATKRALRPAPVEAPKPLAVIASPEEELALLRKAQSALNRSASAALTIADEHAQLYPNGLFVQEREMLRIEAELTLGKRREALDRAHAFSERFASSTYRARIDQLLETHRALKKQETLEAEPTQ